MKSAFDLDALRKQIGAIDGSIPKETKGFSLFPQGFPCGSLIEIAGTGKTSFVAAFLKEHPNLKSIWIEKKLSVNPYALWQHGVDIRNILFVECGNEANWVLQQVLTSQVFPIALISDFSFSEKELRKYQLLTEKNNSQVFLLSQNLHRSWVPALQIKMEDL